MIKKTLSLVLFLSVALLTSPVHAALTRVFVGEFTVSGVTGRDDLKTTIPALLASRLNSDTVRSVDTPTEAEFLVNGSYTLIGKMFSLDISVRRGASDSSLKTRVFEQGESQDELIPAIGRVAQKLNTELAKIAAATPPPRVAEQPPYADTTTEKRPAQAKTVAGKWLSQRLTGTMVAIAVGRTYENGERELYIADDHALRLYRQGETLQLLAEAKYTLTQQILGVDTADLDGDGIPEVYVTIVDGENLMSQILVFKDGVLRRTAEKLPFFFRAIRLNGRDNKIYVQQQGLDTDFYGDVYELIHSGNRYEHKNPIKLPRFGNLYNFNQITDAAGKKYFLVVNDSGYLIVYALNGEELWRSSDRYGGTELNFKREDLNGMRVTGDQYRTIFLEQRLIVTADGEIIIPQNDGFIVRGKNRSYSKYVIVAFTWNGSSLEEKWRTAQVQNYLADYSVTSPKKELILLERVKKDGMFSSGASVVSIRRAD